MTRSLSAPAPAARPRHSGLRKPAGGFWCWRKARSCRPTAARRISASSSPRAVSTTTTRGSTAADGNSFRRNTTISVVRRSGTAPLCCGLRRRNSRPTRRRNIVAGRSAMTSWNLTMIRRKRCCACAALRSSPTPRALSRRSSASRRPGAPRRCRSGCRPAFSTTRAKRPASTASPRSMISNPTPRSVSSTASATSRM